MIILTAVKVGGIGGIATVERKKCKYIYIYIYIYKWWTLVSYLFLASS